MTEGQIVSFLSSNISTLITPVKVFAGSILTAIFLRKNTATQEFEKIKAGKLQEVADDMLNSGKMTYTEYYKAKNFLKIAQKADDYYSNYSNKNNDYSEYSFDWYIRFYEAAGNISDDSIQDIWAKILAGEINHPHSFSLRTIDVLKNMGKKEADLLTKIVSNCLKKSPNKLFIPHNDNYMYTCGITYADILYMDELGLMYSDGNLSYTIKLNNGQQWSFTNRDLILMLSNQNTDMRVINIQQYPLTSAGNELASLTESFLSDENFLLFAKEIKKEGNINVTVHKIISICNDTINYDIENLLEFE